jgi:hypothetical protein
MSLHDAWTALRHGGNLVSPAALDGLPAPERPSRDLADRLRSALVALDPEKPAPAALGALLDVVLEEACGLRDGWQKGNALGAADAEKLLDGVVLKPRRRWTGPGGEVLAAFFTPATRIGVGKGRRPAAHVVEYLRRRSLPLALLTNGRQWRLIWADTDSLAWAEWEAERWLDADLLSAELAVLRRVLAPASLLRANADLSPLLVAIRDTRRGQGKLSKDLGERVRQAVELLLLSRQSQVAPVWENHQGADLYVAACHFVMRLVVTLFAEARELLPVDNRVYHQAYGLRGLLDQLDRLSPERRKARSMAWPRLLALFRLLHQGSLHGAMLLRAYGGDLFRAGDDGGDGVQRALSLLESLLEPPDDDVIHRVLVLLTRTTQKVREGSVWRTVAAPVDFTELTSEYIGILYEGLLDYELHRAGAEPVLFLNLGDQPALPLDRLEAMDDKALVALVEKAKVKKKVASGEKEGDDEDAEDAESSEDDEDTEETGDPEESDAPAVPETWNLDDARIAARSRAVAWGRRAVEVGKLVKKPKGLMAEARIAWNAQLDAAAEQLVADVKLPGELYLVRWGGTRKGAGTFYTRPQLTLPTVRRTLEPLIYEQAGDKAGTVRPPDELLALKVCDPAMGSGSFLVAALRVLTEAVVESLHVHERIERTNGRSTVDCKLLPEADRSLPTDGFEESLEAIVRRAVVEHCLYGVDLDPLAVELARVALWVETLDRRLPFTFLDHKLRCGNALVGTWLDRFRDYPLLCFDRVSPDRKYKGLHHAADVWHEALKEKRAQAIAGQVEILTGQLRLQAATSDEELRTAVERVRRLYRELRAVPAARPDERARIWRERIQTDTALAKVREAFDTWCALWFWPLDELDALPLPAELHAPSEKARAMVKSLTGQQHFFHWELEFPDVFIEERAGFNVVVGNPPWEIQKPSSKEFFSNHDPLYRAYGKQEALEEQRLLFKAVPAIEAQWLAYLGDFKDRGNFVRHAGEPFGDAENEDGKPGVALVARQVDTSKKLHQKWFGERRRRTGLSDPAHPFRHQGSADLNSYKMFLEVAHALLRPDGQLGLVVPSGLYTDKGTGNLRKLLLNGCRWRWIYGFENRNKLFDIDGRFKFCVTIAEKGGFTQAIQVAFMRHDLEDWATATGALVYSAEQLTGFSPRSLSVLEIRSERDLVLLGRIYHDNAFLGGERETGWCFQYGRELEMTSDSTLFPPIEKWQKHGYRPSSYGTWANGDSLAMPLYEGRMISQFNHSCAIWKSGKGRGAVWEDVEPGLDVWGPQFLLSFSIHQASGQTRKCLKLALMRVSSATNARTVISAAIPGYPAQHSLFTGTVKGGEAAATLALLAILNSYVFDWSVRQRCAGTNVTADVLDQAPVPQVPHVVHSIAFDAARLNLTDHVFAPEAIALKAREKCGVSASLWAVTPHERLRLRCMLDAIVAVLYGLDRDGFAWILKDCDHPKARLSEKVFCRRLDPKGFWRVDKTEDPELRHTVLSLAAFDGLQSAIGAAGNRDTGIQAFCDQNEGDGWMLPETLCLADLGLTRTVDVGEYDERARIPQPVRSRMGERFLDWQLAQTPEESWAECERHAKAILEGLPAPPAAEPDAEPAAPQPRLPGMEH